MLDRSALTSSLFLSHLALRDMLRNKQVQDNNPEYDYHGTTIIIKEGKNKLSFEYEGNEYSLPLSQDPTQLDEEILRGIIESPTRNQGKRWSQEERDLMIKEFLSGKSIDEVANILYRSEFSIECQLNRFRNRQIGSDPIEYTRDDITITVHSSDDDKRSPYIMVNKVPLGLDLHVNPLDEEEVFNFFNN